MPTTHSNAVTYMQHSQLVDADKIGVVDTMMRETSVLGMIPFAAASDLLRDEFYERGALGTKLTGRRSLNETPDAKTGSSRVKKIEQLGIYYQRVDIEKKLAKQNGAVDQLINESLGYMAMDLDYEFFNATVDADGKGFNGLAARCGTVESPYCTVPSGGTLNINASASNFKAFLRLIRSVRSEKLKINPGAQVVLITNKKVANAITSGRDELGAMNVGYGELDIINTRVPFVDDIPIITVGTDSTNQDILPFTETSSSCSAYMMVFDGPGGAQGPDRIPNGVCALAPKDGVSYEEYADTHLNMEQYLLEFYLGIRTPMRSVNRIPGLLVTA